MTTQIFSQRFGKWTRQNVTPVSTGGGAAAGHGLDTRSKSVSRAVPLTAAQWAHERILEATRAGYQVRFKYDLGVLTASYWNGEFHCYDRVHIC